MRISSWIVEAVSRPMVWLEREVVPEADQVVVEVAGCGVCHTDLGFFYDGVPTRRAFPLTLGHEISGIVVETGADTAAWMGKQVIVPAVIPCGECGACLAGYGAICPQQLFPGSDMDGGFGTHVVVPARGLCPVPDLSDPLLNPHGISLETLAVVADAVSTPYQALVRSGLKAGDLAIFIGIGGVGGFGAQLAAAMGARVVVIDVDATRLSMLESHGADLALNAREYEFKALKREVATFAQTYDIPSWRTKIFETSGTASGQETAFGLLGKGGHLGIIGFTLEKVSIRLSNLMAFDAVLQGNWGCLPEHYPSIVDLVLAGKVDLPPFVEFRPMDTINEVFAEVHARLVNRRLILVPEKHQV